MTDTTSAVPVSAVPAPAAATLLRTTAREMRNDVAAMLHEIQTSYYWSTEVPADQTYADGIEGGLGGAAGRMASKWTPSAVLAAADWLDVAAQAAEALDAGHTKAGLSLVAAAHRLAEAYNRDVVPTGEGA